jgi:D-xylose reductase
MSSPNAVASLPTGRPTILTCKRCEQHVNLPAHRSAVHSYLIHFPIALGYGMPFLPDFAVDKADPSDGLVDPSARYPPEWHQDGKIVTERAPLHLTWAAMESLVDQKLVRNLGVCSFPGALLMDLMTYARIPPSVHQVEMHPYNTQQDQKDLCDAFDIKMMAFCSFGPAR